MADGAQSAVVPPHVPVLFLFLDGVGLGQDVPEINPFAAAHMPCLRTLIGGALTRSLPTQDTAGLLYGRLDAGLGHPGLPQSATGQTTLLTGINGADVMHGHYGPWPGPTLQRFLQADTLFHQAPGGSALANVYPADYFRALGTRRLRPNAPVVAAKAAGVRLRTMDDYLDGNAVPADLTGAYFADGESAVAAVEPREAGARLARLARANAFTFFDLWLTDRYGHQRSQQLAILLLQRIDAFLAGLLPALGPTTLVLTSDHGNLEDLSTKGHTRNPVPLLVVGPGAPAFAHATGLEDVAPAIRSLWANA